MTADIAVLAMAVMGLANAGMTYRLHMRALEKMGDRVRVVSPPKQQAPAAAAGTVEDLDRRRAS